MYRGLGHFVKILNTLWSALSRDTLDFSLKNEVPLRLWEIYGKSIPQGEAEIRSRMMTIYP